MDSQSRTALVVVAWLICVPAALILWTWEPLAIAGFWTAAAIYDELHHR